MGTSRVRFCHTPLLTHITFSQVIYRALGGVLFLWLLLQFPSHYSIVKSFLFDGAGSAIFTKGPVIDLGYAKYQGDYVEQYGQTYLRFYGIRYAAPPTGMSSCLAV